MLSMTPATLRFLRDLLGRQQIAADNPDIVELAILIRDVRQELDLALLNGQANLEDHVE
jgi:hypothetical protein